MARQTESGPDGLAHVGMSEHEGFTRMLFIDALCGVGFSSYAAAVAATDQGLASMNAPAGRGDEQPSWSWNRTALETLPTATLQDLYTSIKLHKVTHAG